MLSITTDFARDTGNPEPYLRRIAEAGFTHIHWCHLWNTDFLYSTSEIEQIGAWLHELGLQLLDIHASDGQEKDWASVREYERCAGVELVQNRIGMAARLGSDAIVMHIPGRVTAPENGQQWAQLRRSLDELEPSARSHGVRIAIENTGRDNVQDLQTVLATYAPDYVGLCYDCGHGNLAGFGLRELEQQSNRLIAVHLHDNDGGGDLHWIPFTGSVDWEGVARVMAGSAYHKCVSMESNMHASGIHDEREFLQRAHAAGERLTQMIATVHNA